MTSSCVSQRKNILSITSRWWESTGIMTGSGLVLNMGSFRMPVEIKPTTKSGTMSLLLENRAYERARIIVWWQDLSRLCYVSLWYIQYFFFFNFACIYILFALHFLLCIFPVHLLQPSFTIQQLLDNLYLAFILKL